MSKQPLIPARRFKLDQRGITPTPPGAHISGAGAVQTPARPQVVIQWRIYPGSPYCWQVISLAGQKVYIACEQVQPGQAVQSMQQARLAFSEAEADALHQQMLAERNKPQLWRPGMPLEGGR